MTRFQSILSGFSSSPAGGAEDDSAPEQGSKESEDATMKAADRISAALTGGRHLSHEQRASAGPVVHYTFGAVMGALYGLAVERSPTAATAWGVPFGTALWAGADEVAVPAFHLSAPPTEHPLSTHLSALGAHMIYGLTADAVRRTVRSVL